MITIKDGVRITKLTREGIHILHSADYVYDKNGIECVLTCGMEAHKDTDPHTHGYAYDFRTWHIKSESDKSKIATELQQTLGPDYFVLLEHDAFDTNGKLTKREHIHVQIRKGLWQDIMSGG